MAHPKQAANLGDIAQALGVSVATVSNALSGKGRVSADMVPRVREMAARMGYVPSSAGRALRTGRTGVLGLVLPDISSPLFPQIAQAIEFAASSAGYGILIADSRGDAAHQVAAINRLVGRDVDGLVVVPRRGTQVSDVNHCPVAVIDSPSTPGNTVSADHWQGGEALGRHLADLGHRKVVLIGSDPASNVQSDRIDGMRAGLVEAQIEELWIERHEALHGQGAPLGLESQVERGFTAFAAVSDLHALRAMTELHRAGIGVPEEVSITGFDDLSWSGAIIPALTTMRMDMPRIAEIAIASLVRAIEGKAEAATGIVSSVGDTRIPMSLVVRQTSGPAPAPQRQHISGVGTC